MVEREFDILLWGATGWTGVHLVEYFIENYPLRVGAKHGLKWALVARSSAKLDKVISLLVDEYPSESDWIKNVPRIIVDNLDEAKVQETVKRTKSVATVVGPYAIFGEPLLKVCAENGTHYCDITGESPWIKQMIDKYHSVAQDSGAFIVPSTGCDSVPSDLAAFSLVGTLSKAVESEFGKDVNVLYEVKGYVTDGGKNNRGNSNAGGGGTVLSMLNMVENYGWKSMADNYLLCPTDDEIIRVDGNRSSSMVPGREPRLTKSRYTTHWVMATVNEKCVRRSQALLKNVYGPRFSYTEALALGNPFAALGASIAFPMAYGLLSFGPTRALAKRFLPVASSLPALKPSPAKYKPGKFTLEVVGKAIVKNSEGEVVKTFNGSGSFKAFDDIAWAETSKMMAEAALTLIEDADKVREFTNLHGGLITPACLGQRYIDRLASKNIAVEAKMA